MTEIVKFSVNDWTPEKDYPDVKPFGNNEGSGWMDDYDNLEATLLDDEWCKKNKLCVLWHFVDQSINILVTAPKEWVEKNCPCILGSKFEYSRDCEKDRFGGKFLEYNSENIGAWGNKYDPFYDKKFNESYTKKVDLKED